MQCYALIAVRQLFILTLLAALQTLRLHCIAAGSSFWDQN